ncbi:DUF2591 family protein [Enterobacter kobei]|uniref:phage protein NinX family protein n=1 Tax=Enterobacter kobei TaxID=208224 RepID=UPI00187F95CC|nr:phage protein NinX family protein [Enterobacter kobei]MBE8915118.1 DUF2591 family protein [Enterobacter kobei]
MDYSQLSDFEINSAVSMALLDKSANPSARYVAIGNYCNNPADAWPIIVGRKINIRFGAEGMACEAQFMQYGHESVECYHANPLRAAMIVFLQMQDTNHA